MSMSTGVTALANAVAADVKELQDRMPHVGLKAGRVYGPLGREVRLQAQDYSVGTGILICSPIYVPNTATINQLGVSTGSNTSGAQIRFSIYRAGTNGSPKNKIYQSAAVTVPTSGPIVVGGVSAILSSGLHFIAITLSRSINIKIRPNTVVPELFGDSDIDSNQFLPYYTLAGFPVTLPADISALPVAGYLDAYCPEFFWTIS